jgi:hypothetical protein
MKQILLFGLVMLLVLCSLKSFSQTNTYPWPSSANVGIGTTSPLTKLHIYGNIAEPATPYPTGSAGILRFDSESNVALDLGFRSTGNYGVWLQAGDRSNTNGSVYPILINPLGGNVGIGTASPSVKLDVTGDIRSTTKILLGTATNGTTGQFATDGTDTYLDYNGILNLREAQYSANRVTILANGNTGIGTTPFAKLTLPSGESGVGLLGWEVAVNAASRRWWVHSDYQAYGDFAISTESSKQHGTAPDLNRFYISPAGNVGIGTTSPDKTLTINGELGVQSSGTTKYHLSYYSGGLSFAESGVDDRLFIKDGGNVGIGTITPGDYKLNVWGRIRAHEVVVNTSGADFVFESDYKLPTLTEVESFIKENRHLPDFVSAHEMNEKGLNVSEMQTKLLQKIEELTLYVIEQNKKIQSLDKKVRELEAEKTHKN